MPLSPLEYLRHMLNETEYLTDQSLGLSKDEFIHDVIINKLPELRQKIEQILESEKDESDS